jgi:hypothetical protein
MPPRARTALLALALLVVGVVALESWRRPRAEFAAVQARQSALAQRWRAERTRHATTLDDTYAVVAAGPRNALWSELLQASGVPSPLELRAGQPIPTRARFVVCDETPCAAGPERATIEVIRGPGRTAQALRWDGLRVPLAGFEVVHLTLEDGEHPLATDDAGGVVAALRSRDGGVRLRLGLDLASALWRLRFGTPDRADHDHDGNGELQPADLAPIVRGEAIARPFADELIAALLTALDRALPCALPRTRGLPEGVRSLLVLTSDQDFEDDVHVRAMAEDLAQRGARATFLLTDPTIGLPADLHVASGAAPRLQSDTARALRTLGHALGAHPFPRHAAEITRHLDGQTQRLGVRPLAMRNHHLRWFGYDDIPRAESAAGVALNLDAMPISDGTTPSVGFSGGAAQPVMFVDVHGARIPLLHQITAVDDFHLRVDDYPQLAPAATRLAAAGRRILDAARAAEVPVVLNAHPSLYRFAPEWLHAILDAPEVHAVSTDDWLSFVLDRRATRIPAARCTEPRAAALRPGVTLQRNPRLPPHTTP